MLVSKIRYFIDLEMNLDMARKPRCFNDGTLGYRLIATTFRLKQKAIIP